MRALLLILVIVLQLLDGWTTYRILSTGGRELNPVLAWAIRKIGTTPALVVSKVGAIALAIVAYMLTSFWIFVVIMVPVVIIYCHIVRNNWRQL